MINPTNVKRRASVLIHSGEGFSPHFYLDTTSHVTVGYGVMLPDAAATATIQMFHRTTRRAATTREKAAEWSVIRRLYPPGTDLNLPATTFAPHTTLIITQAEADRLFEEKLNEFIPILRANYPGFDTFPEDAQVAMLDMVYNLGNGIHATFVNFTRAINNPNGPDWVTAARESNRPQVPAKRNLEVYNLFISAANAQAATP